MDFVRTFERQCGSQASVKRLRAHPAYHSFNNKWNLPVYFQIRSVIYPPHLHPSKIGFEHQLRMLAPANSPFLMIIILFFGKQNLEWKCTGSTMIAKVPACMTKR